MGTATAKVGYALFNRSLWYVRGGVAYGDLKITTTCNTGPFNVFGVIGCSEAASRNRTGWTAGFGSEFALAQNWTVRTETNYFDMGKENYTLPVSLVRGTVKDFGFISTVGLNYRFSAGPVVAKY
jgi:opacity protein-like surface antigen